MDIGTITQNMADAKQAYDKGIGSLWHYSDSSKNFIAQTALAEQANAHEIAMWNMQNEYNTPEKQMERFKEAGLNPMLAYTQGSNGNASSAPGTHVPNFKITRDQDNLQKAAAIINAFQAVNGMVQDVISTVEQTYELGIKRNEKAWSDLDYAAAANAFADFDQGHETDPRFRTTSVNGTTNIMEALNPYSPNFSPSNYRVLDRLGVTGFLPKMTSAEANAKYSGVRTEYQDYYNKNILPLEKQYKEGKIDIQNLQKSMIGYQDKVLEMIPPEYRAILVPVLQYLRPLINTSLRFH